MTQSQKYHQKACCTKCHPKHFVQISAWQRTLTHTKKQQQQQQVAHNRGQRSRSKKGAEEKETERYKSNKKEEDSYTHYPKYT